MLSGRQSGLWLMQQRSAEPPLSRPALAEELVYRTAILLSLTSVILAVGAWVTPGLLG